MITLIYLIVTGQMINAPFCDSTLYRFLRPDDCPSAEVPPVVVKNVALPSLSMVDSEPGRMCRITAVRRRADVPLGGSAHAYFEIEGVPVDSNEPQRTYITNNIFILSDGSDVEYQAIAEDNFPIGTPESIETCTPEFGNK